MPPASPNVGPPKRARKDLKGQSTLLVVLPSLHPVWIGTQWCRRSLSPEAMERRRAQRAAMGPTGPGTRPQGAVEAAGRARPDRYAHGTYRGRPVRDRGQERSRHVTVETDAASSEPLHRALGLTDGERDEVEAILGRPPNHLELALFAVMWSEHCSYKSSRVHLQAAAHRGPPRAGRPGGERRGHRRRRRDRRGHPHREPQPPLGHRALPGRGHRGRGHPPGHLHHGGPAHRGDGPAVLRRSRARPASSG